MNQKADAAIFDHLDQQCIVSPACCHRSKSWRDLQQGLLLDASCFNVLEAICYFILHL